MENICFGDFMVVYKQKGVLGMLVGIIVNNFYVVFFIFVLGVFFLVGVIVMIV